MENDGDDHGNHHASEIVASLDQMPLMNSAATMRSGCYGGIRQPNPKPRAVIDVGSNSVKLLVAEVAEGKVNRWCMKANKPDWVVKCLIPVN